jgi:hypothetical protein
MSHPLIGVHNDISIEAYHSSVGISKSGLDDINRSPYHYWAYHLAPDRPPEPDRAGDQLTGALLHCALLEPDEFDKRYAVGPDVNRNTTVWKDFVKEHPGHTIIKRDQRFEAFQMADSLRKIKEIRTAMLRGTSEVSAYWEDEETGALCRCRPDFVCAAPDGDILIDAKTYKTAKPSAFASQMARMRYHVQGAFYTDGYGAASKRPVIAFLFAAVETTYPYAASSIMLDVEDEANGRKEYRRNLNTYAECLRTNTWPGYGENVQTVRMPLWTHVEE